MATVFFDGVTARCNTNDSSRYDTQKSLVFDVQNLFVLLDITMLQTIQQQREGRSVKG